MMERGWLFEYTYNKERWSTSEEYDTKEEAIQAGIEFFREEDPDVTSFLVGQRAEPEIYIFPQSIVEDLRDYMYEEVGEYADYWLDNVTKDELNELKSLITDWVKRVDSPKFFKVIHVQDIEIPPIQ